jgi:hypothetical protein
MANAVKNAMTFAPPSFVPVAEDGSAVFELELDVSDDARMHQEYIRGLVVAEGTVSFVTRPVWVRPRLRRRPPALVGAHVPASQRS